MRVKAISFSKHNVLGELSLNFCSPEGNPIDTIILAGENGTGKTTILNTLFYLFDVQNLATHILNEDIAANTSVLLEVPDEFLHAFLGDEYKEEIRYSHDFRIDIVDFANDLWSRAKITIFDESGKIVPSYQHSARLAHERVKPFFSTVFNDVQINFTPNPVQHTTALELDQDYGIKKSTTTMATEIAQLFVDIQASDDQDLALWVDEHPDVAPPNEIKRTRIKRFDRAFSRIFSQLSYYKITNKASRKVVVFLNHGKEVPIEKLSSGEKQIVFRGGFILKDSNINRFPLLLIDEPEISLHPDWQKRILDFYKQLITDETGKQRSQLFAVTHSPFIIHNENRTNDKVLVLARDTEGKICVLDKPEYYRCTSVDVVKDAFAIRLLDVSESAAAPYVFLEGKTDETYMNKAVELFGLKIPINIQWIGRVVKNSPENTGDSALNAAYRFLCANPSVCPQGAVLLYDSDTRKSEMDENNIHTRVMPEKKSAVGFTIGIENMLNLPVDFDKTPFIKQSLHKDKYGIVSTECELDKTRLCDYICSKLDVEEQRRILEPLKENILIIESSLM